MGTFPRVLAVAVIAAGAALGAAGPAQAESQVLDGIYTYTQADGLTVDWTIYPTCVPIVGDLREPLYIPVGCHLHVESSGRGTTGGDARLVNGAWEYNVASREGLTCPDGTVEPVRETFAFNTDTMTGTRTTLRSPGCDGAIPASMVKTPFTLAHKSDGPLPVDDYPLICEPGGLRRCF